MNIESVRIGVSRDKFIWYNPMRWVSALIRLFTGKFNHAFFIINDEFIIEADSEGVNSTPFSNSWCEGKTIRVYNFNYQLDLDAMYDNLDSQIGKGYDYKGTLIDQFLFSIRKLFYRVFDGKKPRWTGHSKDFSTKKFYCSELVGYIVNFSNPELFPSWEQYHPTDIYKLAESTDLLTLYYDGKAINY